MDGYDADESSIELARRNAEVMRVADRVAFHVRDVSAPTLEDRYDLATAFECVHDMGRPVEALQAMRHMVGEEGTVIVAAERVPDSFRAPGDGSDRLMYGWSVLFCLPTGLADEPSVGTGTVMRQRTLRRYAEEAGYRGPDHRERPVALLPAAALSLMHQSRLKQRSRNVMFVDGATAFVCGLMFGESHDAPVS